MASLGLTYSDVIVDSLMVIQSRRYPENGSEDLTAFSWTFMAIGGLVGSIAAGIITQLFYAKLCFIISAAISLLIAALATRLNFQLEIEGLESQVNSTLGLWGNVKRNCSEIKQGLMIKEFFYLIIFLLLSGLLVPKFGGFAYYFAMDVIGITKFAFSMLHILGFVGLAIGTQLFNKYLTRHEYWRLIMCESMLHVALAPLQFILVFRLTIEWGIPDMAVIIFDHTVGDIIGQAMVFMPMCIIFAKICPKHIEATTYALLSGVSNFRGSLGAWIGAIINKAFVGVT